MRKTRVCRSSSGRARTASTTPCRARPSSTRRIRRARDDCERNARLLGVSRRSFLLSVCGAATTLLALNACSDESIRATKGRKPGGTFDIPTTASTDPDAARAALAGNEFVFDVQGHFLEYRVNPATSQGRDFWMGFPQRGCGESDRRVCFSINHFMEEVFLKSDTSMIVLERLADRAGGQPDVDTTDGRDPAARGRVVPRSTRAACRRRRCRTSATRKPGLDAMAAAKAAYPIVAWKVFTNFPDLYDGSGNAWRLDDGNPSLPQVGNAFIEQAVELGVPIITAHKGLSTTLGYTSPHASPADFGPRRRRTRT